jgi:hypothetical protein
MGSFGKFLVYLIDTSFGGVLCLFFSGLLAGLGLSALFKGAKVEGENSRRLNWRIGIILGMSLVFLIAALAAGKVELAAYYWPIFLLGLLIGLFLRLFPAVTSGITFVLAVLVLVLLCSLVMTFRAFTGKTAVLEVAVREVRQEGRGRITTLVVTDIEDDRKETYRIEGTKWGISANVAVLDNWVLFLGGKTYYRVNSIVGVDQATIKRQSFYSSSQPTWDELWEEVEMREGKIPGVRAVYEDIVLKTPVEGRVYRIYVDNDGGVVPELIRETKP